MRFAMGVPIRGIPTRAELPLQARKIKEMEHAKRTHAPRKRQSPTESHRGKVTKVLHPLALFRLRASLDNATAALAVSAVRDRAGKPMPLCDPVLCALLGGDRVERRPALFHLIAAAMRAPDRTLPILR